MHDGRGSRVQDVKQQKARDALIQIRQPSVFFKLLRSMTSTSDTDSCTAAEPVQTLTPPPSPPLAEDGVTTTATPPPTSAAAKKKKKKKSKKSNKTKEGPTPSPTPAPTVEENQPPPLYISRNKHWKYISSFHVRTLVSHWDEGTQVLDVI